MGKRLFIQAVNIHQGGGRKLLEGLLAAIDFDEYEYVLILDSRMPLLQNFGSNTLVRQIKHSVFQRLMNEAWLFRNTRSGDHVLCLGNLPPLFRLQAFTSVFLQNRYLIDLVGLSGFVAWDRLRITFERVWLRFAHMHANEYLVQTPTMLRLTNVLCNGRVPVNVIPFAVSQVPAKSTGNAPSIFSDGFIYVASGEPHKNHKQLINAWCLLAQENIFPSLFLTLDKNVFSELCVWIEEKVKEHKLSVDNLGILSSEALSDVYAKTGALIYPSTFESLGLPLIEAEQAGIPILASELDYVRDVVNPVQTFNPESAISIAKAVKRFLGLSEIATQIKSPGAFMQHLLSRSN
jgi:glycosyltransferase involved in cell wall biosynthesis